MRCCAECKEPFTDARPPVEPVELRSYQPGATVPRLQIVAHGSRCAACARQTITQPKPMRAKR